MSRTIRTLKNRKWAKEYNQGQIQKLGLPKYSSKRSRKGKAHVGPGGIGCVCCTKGEPHQMKRWARKAERHEFNPALAVKDAVQCLNQMDNIAELYED